MLIWTLTLGIIALYLAGRALVHVLRQIPEGNEGFDALSTRAQP